LESLTWQQVLGWRVKRQFIDPLSEAGVVDVVRRLAGVQAQVTSAAELAISVRQARPKPGAAADALWAKRSLMKTWAMRGTLHWLAAEEAGNYLSLMAAGRSWERPSWQRTFGATPEDIEAIAAAAAKALEAGRPLTREALTAQIVARTGSKHLAEVLGSGWGTLLKPLAWWGVLCHGPSQGGRVTFVSPATWVPSWSGVPDADAAAPSVIRAYLGAHGPSTPGAFNAWLTRGLLKKSVVQGWFDSLGDELVAVDVDGSRAYVAAENLSDLRAQKPNDGVYLLPAFDQYILGAGTSDDRVVPAEHRPDISRAAGWISPVVLHRGRAAGTWEVTNGGIADALWEKVPTELLESAKARMQTLVSKMPTAPKVGGED
jgi:hypothetical protein